jgi:hypothetical protein
VKEFEKVVKVIEEEWAEKYADVQEHIKEGGRLNDYYVKEFERSTINQLRKDANELMDELVDDILLT